MTIRCQEERLIGFIHEAIPLLIAQYEELTFHKGVVKFCPKWGEYLALDDMGMFHAFTARDDGRLIGYNWFFLNTHMHYADLRYASNDVFYIHRDYRAGPAALMLLRHSERALKALGAKKIAYHCKGGNNLLPIMRKLRYEQEEVIVTKLL